MDNDASKKIFVAAGTSLPSFYVTMKERIQLTAPLSSYELRDTHIDTQTDGRDL
jgi:hypothetical protein